MTCKVYKKYNAGKTVHRFRYDGITSDRKFLRGEKIKQKSLHEHILEDDLHSFKEDISIRLIDITDPSDSHKRALPDENH